MQKPNIIIRWFYSKHEWPWKIEEGFDPDCPFEDTEYLNLMFSILVNGKLVDYVNSFELQHYEELAENWEEKCTRISLKNWGEWYPVASLLDTLWNYLTNTKETAYNFPEYNALMEDWISKVI